jgi:hypothetical protein
MEKNLQKELHEQNKHDAKRKGREPPPSLVFFKNHLETVAYGK